MTERTRLLIVDDSARARTGLRYLLTTWPGVEVVGEAANGQDAVRLVAASGPDVVLMDLEMPVLDGLQALRLIKEQAPAVRVVVLTMFAEQQARALAAGADAYVLKGGTPEELLSALGLGAAEGKP